MNEVPPSLLDGIHRAKLTAPDGAPSDLFGFSVAVSGDTAVVGATQDETPAGALAGSAHVFVRSGTMWQPQAHLTASDGSAGDFFGHSVALDGDTAVVGTLASAAYVFVRSGSDWTQQAKLTSPDGGLTGFSVALSGDTAVVSGASGYVFLRSGTTWNPQAKLTPSDGAFARTVDLDGDIVLVGDPYHDTPGGAEAGSAYVFARSGTTWTQRAKLTASDGAAEDFFGYSLSLDGDIVLVGAYGDDTPSGRTAGSAYVFVRSGTTWTEQAHLTASDGNRFDAFGVSVALDGPVAVIGANADNTPAGPDAGSIYVFLRSGSGWTENAHLTAGDGAAGDAFGSAVALDRTTAVVGAPWDNTSAGADAGSAYVFWR